MLSTNQQKKLELVEGFRRENYPGAFLQIQHIAHNVLGRPINEEEGLKYFVLLASRDSNDIEEFNLVFQKLLEHFDIDLIFKILFRISVLKNGVDLFFCLTSTVTELKLNLGEVLNGSDSANLGILDYFYMSPGCIDKFSQDETPVWKSNKSPIAIVRGFLELGGNGEDFFVKIDSEVDTLKWRGEQLGANDLVAMLKELKSCFNSNAAVAQQASSCSSSSSSSTPKTTQNIMVFNQGVLSIVNSIGCVTFDQIALSSGAKIALNEQFAALIKNNIQPAKFFENLAQIYANER